VTYQERLKISEECMRALDWPPGRNRALPREEATAGRDEQSESKVTSESLARIEAHMQQRLNGQVRGPRLTVRGDGLVLKGLTRTHDGTTRPTGRHGDRRFARPANEIEIG
jgi:hypothetical protein